MAGQLDMRSDRRNLERVGRIDLEAEPRPPECGGAEVERVVAQRVDQPCGRRLVWRLAVAATAVGYVAGDRYCPGAEAPWPEGDVHGDVILDERRGVRGTGRLRTRRRCSKEGRIDRLPGNPVVRAPRLALPRSGRIRSPTEGHPTGRSADDDRRNATAESHRRQPFAGPGQTVGASPGQRCERCLIVAEDNPGGARRRTRDERRPSERLRGRRGLPVDGCESGDHGYAAAE